MQEIPRHIGAIESAELLDLGQERDGCLGNTVASIVSTISGQEYHLPPIYYAYRGMTIKDELRTFKRHIRKNPEKPRDQLEMAMHRLDQRVFKMLIKSIKETGIALPAAAPIASMLESCTVEYRKGDFNDMLEAVNSQHEVAVMYKAPEEEDLEKGERWWHMAHIGISKGQQIVRISDDNALVTNATIAAINESASYLNREVRTWNFVTVKSTCL